MEMRGRLRPFAPRESNSCGGVRFAAFKRAAIKTVQLSHGTCYVWRQSRESIAGMGERLKPIAIGKAETVQRSHPPLLRARNVRARLLALANSPTHLPLDNETSQAVCAWELQTAKLSSTFAWGGQNRPNRRPKPAEAGRGRSGLVGDWSELVGTGRNWSGTGRNWSELVGAGRGPAGRAPGATGRKWAETEGNGPEAFVGSRTAGAFDAQHCGTLQLSRGAFGMRRQSRKSVVGMCRKPEALGTWARNIV